MQHGAYKVSGSEWPTIEEEKQETDQSPDLLAAVDYSYSVSELKHFDAIAEYFKPNPRKIKRCA